MRSLLFTPGDVPHKLEKAYGAGADALLIDLEDSVAPERKEAARAIAAEFLAAHCEGWGKGAPALYVRINGLDTPEWETDVERVVPGRPAGLLVPKTRGGGDLATLDAALGRIEARSGLSLGQTRLLALVTEAPVSLLRMESYVGASRRLAGLAWGGEDLSLALGARANRGEDGTYTSPYVLARDLCLITAAACEVEAIDAVFVDYRDMEGLAEEAEAAARDGFDGKMAIHPAQVPIINAAFTPGEEDIARAKAILAAFEKAPGAAVVGLDGVMLDRPHLLRARRTLEKARLAANASS